MTLKPPSIPWCDVFGTQDVLMATGLHAWICVLMMRGRWHAVRGDDRHPIQRLALGDRQNCLAVAELWFQQVAPTDLGIIEHWMARPASPKQLTRLSPLLQTDTPMTRYQASARLQFQYNAATLVRLVNTVASVAGEVL
ncbi:MAG TPA: hypothetical protein PKZ52_09930 [Cellvibrionaceae bacterium]|nr:hypothetical protein [Cellvibrionaceae bacterium]